MIFFDTNAVIIAIQGARDRKGDTQAQAFEDVQASRAQAFVKNHAKGELGISTVTLTEFVCGFPPEQQEQTVATANSFFEVYPVDAATAALTAQLRYQAWTEEVVRETYKGSRKCFNADCSIVATAVQRKAKLLVAYDGGIEKILERVKGRKPALMDQFPEGEQKVVF